MDENFKGTQINATLEITSTEGRLHRLQTLGEWYLQARQAIEREQGDSPINKAEFRIVAFSFPRP